MLPIADPLRRDSVSHQVNYGLSVMSKSVLDAKALNDEATAYVWVEARLWPNGPVCPAAAR